jgi:hypothetical protein
MYCPQCGQERVSESTSFCSRCGYLLTGTAELLPMGGALPQMQPTDVRSPRSRGVRQGLFMFLLMFVLAPVVGLISQFGLGIEPWPVGVVVALFGFGGLLRIAYAMMFESKFPPALPESRLNRELPHSPYNFSTSALPPERGPAASDFVTPAFGRQPEPVPAEPSSVTDETTKLLEKKQKPD